MWNLVWSGEGLSPNQADSARRGMGGVSMLLTVSTERVRRRVGRTMPGLGGWVSLRISKQSSVPKSAFQRRSFREDCRSNAQWPHFDSRKAEKPKCRSVEMRNQPAFAHSALLLLLLLRRNPTRSDPFSFSNLEDGQWMHNHLSPLRTRSLFRTCHVVFSLHPPSSFLLPPPSSVTPSSLRLV